MANSDIKSANLKHLFPGVQISVFYPVYSIINFYHLNTGFSIPK